MKLQYHLHVQSTRRLVTRTRCLHIYRYQPAATPMETRMEVEAEAELSTRSLQPDLVHTKSRAFLRHALPPLPLAMPSPAYKRKRVVVPHPITWTRRKSHLCSLQTHERHPAGKSKRPWMKNRSGCVDTSASEVGVGIGNASPRGGLVTGPPPLPVSLVIAKDIRSESETVIVIAIVKGTVLGSGNETGIGLLDVVVDMAVRVVPAAEADTVKANTTGRWPREWDFNVFAHMGPSITLGQTYMNSQPFMDQVNIVYLVRILFISGYTPL